MEIENGEIADLYVAMSKAIEKIEAKGNLTVDEIGYIDSKCWVALMEKEVEEEKA